VTLAQTADDAELFDWSLWQQYRRTVKHPATTFKAADLARARENIQRYAWAKSYAESVEKGAAAALPKLSAEYLEAMIPTTTPGDSLFTPCPSCRDQKKPWHPHGQWTWSADKPDELKCVVCGTVFPNEKYPESIVLEARRGNQKLTFYGGDTFRIFSYATGRPSFTGNIRARKVSAMTGLTRRLAEAYALTQKPEFAEATRKLLLRFAAVYPNWLVHVGYGEYADMDPHVAAKNINSLPEPEMVYPPNAPDRRLHTGFWSAGRASGVGMEQGFVRAMTEAYDLTCEAKSPDGKPIFSDEERIRIERDLLLEGSVLLAAEKSINNKSVGGRMACALVGMCVGHPALVRFGLEGFMRTVDEWFLPDGCTSESPGYASMTLSGIEATAQMFRGYTDPPGYAPKDGKRIEGLDLYHGTSYAKVWKAMFNGLIGNLRYPPYADSYATSDLGARFVELMANNYPDEPQYLALLKEIAGPDLSKGYTSYAIYYREPGLESKPTPPLTLPDIVFPALRLGYLRTGADGRESCLLLSASHWGGHHHVDSLNLWYWKQGHELLTDLGYLWDHPKSGMTRRTFAHNLVMIDDREQETTNRGGEFHLFHADAQSPVKVMEASSQAYPQAKLYRRTAALIDHGAVWSSARQGASATFRRPSGNSYVVDIFRVQGGQKRDYVFHGPNSNVQLDGLTFAAAEVKPPQVRFAIRFHVDKPGCEIWVDDVEITPVGGQNMAANPSAAEATQAGKPVGWGCYVGDGKCEWGAAQPGRTDERCAHLKTTDPGKQMPMNVALIQGDSNGYTGEKAYLGHEGATYRVSFHLRGTAPRVNVAAVLWRGDPKDANRRHHEPLVLAVPTPQWRRHEATFTIPGDTDLANVKRADASGVWRATWQFGVPPSGGAFGVPPSGGQFGVPPLGGPPFRFTALSLGEPGETALIGDGWGQRDYRNSDIGVTLPYIVRRQTGADGFSAFASVLEGYRGEQPFVKQARRLPVPAEEKTNTVALQVQTADSDDYLVSCLEARPIALETPSGRLEFQARFAAVSLRDGKILFATLVEGAHLRLGGLDIKPTAPNASVQLHSVATSR